MNKGGFTTTELLIAVITGLLVTGAALSLCHSGNRFVTSLLARQSGWQEARAAATIWAADWRGAGYDPTGNAGATVRELTAGAMRFSADWNANGRLLPTPGNPNERLSYAATSGAWRRAVNSGPLLRIAWPDSLTFRYLDEFGREQGSPASPDRVGIAEARISLCDLDAVSCQPIAWRVAWRNRRQVP